MMCGNWQKSYPSKFIKYHLNYPELFETGSQIRRSSKSIYSNIVEGYGRRRYKNDYLRFLIYAHASVDETRAHLEFLFETGSLKDEETFLKISMKLNTLGRKLYAFIKCIEKQSDVQN